MHHSPDAVREALAVPPDVPLIRTDARLREATKAALLELVQHALVAGVGTVGLRARGPAQNLCRQPGNPS